MSRYADIRDFGPDNLGLRPVPGRELCQCVMIDSGSWDMPCHYAFPAGWKAGQFWKPFLRVLPNQLEEAKQLVLDHGRSLGILLEEGVILMHKSHPDAQKSRA